MNGAQSTTSRGRRLAKVAGGERDHAGEQPDQDQLPGGGHAEADDENERRHRPRQRRADPHGAHGGHSHI